MRRLRIPANSMKDAHTALDKAALAAYGFNLKKGLLPQILALNDEVSARLDLRDPVLGPGVLTEFPDPPSLISPTQWTDCRPISWRACDPPAGELLLGAGTRVSRPSRTASDASYAPDQQSPP